MTRLTLWAPVLAYMALIFYLSTLSSVPIPPSVGDKMLHLLGYSVLAGLVLRALTGGLPGRLDAPVALWAFAITIAYGASDEVHQIFVPGRDGSWLDLLADAGGAILATTIFWAWGIIAPSRAHDV
jgi:VanZ family protein